MCFHIVSEHVYTSDAKGLNLQYHIQNEANSMREEEVPPRDTIQHLQDTSI